MDRQTMLILTPYLVSFTIAAGVGIYAWSCRNTNGAFSFGVLALAEACWMLRNLVELILQDLTIPIFWNNLQFIILAIWPLVFIAFALRYTTRTMPRSKLLWTLLILTTLTLLALALFEQWPAIIQTRIPHEFSTKLTESALLITQLQRIWLGCLFIGGLGILLTTIIAPRNLSRVRIGIVFVGSLFPAAGIIVPLVNIPLPLYQDHLTPLAFGISNLLMAWGIFASQRIPLVEKARDAILAKTDAIIIIGNAQNRIIDLNPAAEAFMTSAIKEHTEADFVSETSLMHEPVEPILSQWPELAQHYQQIEEVRTEITLNIQDGESRLFDLELSPLRNRKGRLLGCLMVLHDITARKQTERILQTTETKLQQTTETLQTTETKLQQTTETLQTTETKLQQTTETLQTTETKLQQTTETLQTTETKLQQTTETLQTTETRLQETKESLRSREIKLQETENALKGNEVRLQETEKALQISETKRQETQEALQASESKLHLTEDALKNNEAKLHKTQDALQESQNRRKQAEEALKDNENRLRQTEKALRTNETKLQQTEKALKKNKNRQRQPKKTQQEKPIHDRQEDETKKKHIPTGKHLPAAQIPEHLAALSDEVLGLLEEAAAQLNPFKISRVLETIWDYDAPLAESIEGFAYQQNYKELLSLVKKARNNEEP